MKKLLLLLAMTSQLPLASVIAQETTTETSQSEMAATRSDWSQYEQDIEGRSPIKLTQVFQENTPRELSQNGVTFSVTRYAYYEAVEGDDRGGLYFVEVSYQNKTDQPVFIPSTYYGMIEGVSASISSSRVALSDALDIFKETMNKKSQVAPGETFTGVFALGIEEDERENLDRAGELLLETPVILPKEDALVSEAYLPVEKWGLSISQANATNQAVQASFYPDAITQNHLGQKTMLQEANNLMKSEDENGVRVTLNGYQWTEFVPNTDQADRFRDFKNGVVTLTVELTVTNQSNRTIQLDSTSGVLEFADTYRMMNEGLLEANEEKQLTSGQEGKVYLVFAISKDDYTLYENRSVDLEVNVYDSNFSQINAADDFDFEIRDLD